MPDKHLELKKAIAAIARGDAEHDTERAALITRAKGADAAGLLPDNWNADGSLKDTRGVWSTQEQRETYNDKWFALAAALSEWIEDQADLYYAWVQDFTDEVLIFCANDDFYQAPYTLIEGGAVTLGDATKVRPVTTWVGAGEPAGDPDATSERSAGPLLDWRKKKVAELRGLERRTFATSDLELRETNDGTLNLTGYASVTDTPYDVGFYTETIARGAFKRTLGEDPDVQLLVNHDGLPLARTKSGTLRLSEDHLGLRVDADLDPEDPDVQSLARKMRRGDIDQMSFAFQATGQEWNDDYSARTITAVSIHRGDVSVVNQGANPATTTSIRSQDAIRALARVGGPGAIAAFTEWRDHTLLTTEERAGKALSASTMEVLTNVLNLIAVADDAVDEAQPLLAELMGVPNPDTDDAGDDTAERSAAPAQPWTPPDRVTRARQDLDRLTLSGRGR